MFNPKTFTADRRDKYECERYFSYPFAMSKNGECNGWKIVECGGNLRGLFILGNPKVKGCFTLRFEGGWEAAWYCDVYPKDLLAAKVRADGSYSDAEFFDVVLENGWADPLIDGVEKGVVCMKHYLTTGEIV